MNKVFFCNFEKHKPVCTGVSVCYRVKLKEGVAFLGARATDPMSWSVSQGVASAEEGGVVTLHCRCRKVVTLGQRSVYLAVFDRFFPSDTFSSSSSVCPDYDFYFLLSEITYRWEKVGGAPRRLLQVDLEVTAFTAAWVGWQLEYQSGGSGHRSTEVTTTIRLAPQELGAIVPLAMVRTSICYVYIRQQL